MFAAERAQRASAPVYDRPGSRPMAWAAALHLVAVLLLLWAASGPASMSPAAPEFRVVPIVEEEALPLVTPGKDETNSASVAAPPAPDLASGGEAPTPHLATAPEAAPEAPPERERVLAEAAPAPAAVAPPLEASPPLPRRKPTPPAVTADAAAAPSRRSGAKPSAAAPTNRADVVGPEQSGGGARGSPDESGSRYLALVRAEIERQRVYPETRDRAVGGTAVFALVVDRDGRLLVLQLRKSSGATVLDDTGAEMIRRATPLPPLPPEIPGEAVELEVALALFAR